MLLCMAETPIGDLVLFEDDERVEAVDVRALQVLVYQCIADALGGLMGETSGVLGGVTFDTSLGPTAVGVGECTLCGFKRVSGSSARVEGLIMHYNPNGAFQIQKTLPATLAAYSSSDRPFIWFARAETPAERATRKKFSAGAERTITPMTRLRQNVLFGVTATADTTPDDVYEWHVFARVTGWSSGNPEIRAYRPWDIGRVPNDDPSDFSYHPGRVVELINQVNETPWLNGLPSVLTYLAQVVCLTRDNSIIFGLDGSIETESTETELPLPFALNGPSLARGTRQLDDALSNIEDRVDELETSTAQGAASQILYIGSAVYDGGLSAYVVTDVYKSNLIDVAYSTQSWTGSGGAHQVRFAVTRPDSPVVVKGFSIQPIMPYTGLNLGSLSLGEVFPIFPVMTSNASDTLPLPLATLPGVMYIVAGLAKHDSADATDVVGHDGQFILYIYGGPS